MKKRCTNSSCRRIFKVTEDTRQCPYCGKIYNRLAANNVKRNPNPIAWTITISHIHSPLMIYAALRKTFGYSIMDCKKRSKHLPMTLYVRDKEKVDSLLEIINKDSYCTAFCTPVYRKKRHIKRKL